MVYRTREQIPFSEKEVTRIKYILKKLNEGSFIYLPKEYKENPQMAIEYHNNELKYWEQKLKEENEKHT